MISLETERQIRREWALRAERMQPEEPMTNKPECHACGADYPPQRAALGYNTCLDCGDFAARTERMGWTIVPLPKQGYTRVTRVEELKSLNQKVK